MGPVYAPVLDSSSVLLVGGEPKCQSREGHGEDDGEQVPRVSLGFPSPLFTSSWMLNLVSACRTRFVASFTKHPCQTPLKQLNCIHFHLPHIKAVPICSPTYVLIFFDRFHKRMAQIGHSGFWLPWTAHKVPTCLGKLQYSPGRDTRPWVAVRLGFD